MHLSLLPVEFRLQLIFHLSDMTMITLFNIDIKKIIWCFLGGDLKGLWALIFVMLQSLVQPCK